MNQLNINGQTNPSFERSPKLEIMVPWSSLPSRTNSAVNERMLSAPAYRDFPEDPIEKNSFYAGPRTVIRDGKRLPSSQWVG
ncbi:hypothetical protein P0D69_43730, partial [Paraburkholderia sediminicola]|uniref:hypothetical protein n=1 Tax=Paraburkholderia sediminicola TaxID=458836 RepID=UPI0038B92307